ncbi:UDP-N-acetylmuramoyl-L-alanyl-D-glutamate--2,6-diaminopimelate ligase [Povalibacter uvarum]|uniref:UDP-N-acetylmuramoyl-L-alanyl-D-glutamate--2,6-diaminopimelate ligase n=2 Tax=Povalibacter uvarum TaxID=732238 RepID=A0A841HNM0_9GAMM|nr:UDP-N-acetylmuramoyl-L-alanyl-D-glutamate--2,6-diaminopimelate ligase [Povalibacter uvarum]
MSAMNSALARRNAVNVTRQQAGKNLRALLAGTAAADVPDLEITDLTIDSRKVRAGGAFVALPGLRSHGVSFATQAISSGAIAVLWEPADGVVPPAVPANVAMVAVPDLKAAIGTIADRFFDSPSAAVFVTGITGTNGKTTTAYVLAGALAELGRPSAYAGTLGHGRIGAVKPGTHTTPDAITLHRQIAELRDEGITHLGMEISSHALDQDRVAGVRVDTAVFTNLTHDHLDYHGTFEAYGEAKARLFAWPTLEHAVINVDDAFGLKLAREYRGEGLVACARSTSSLASLPADTSHVLVRRVRAEAGGLVIDLDGTWGTATLRSRFVGDFNVDNLIAVLAVLLGWGFELSDAVAALERCSPPPGRMETFTAAGKPLAVVDYAHTPDALEKALLAVRNHSSGRLICVFGCGGDRDARKRPAMGEIAERLADVVVITDDNPRTEDGNAIVAGIVAGLKEPQRATVERDRARAIEHAIAKAGAGDVVLVAGKGHEDYQIVGIETRYFSDRDVVQAALRRDA